MTEQVIDVPNSPAEHIPAEDLSALSETGGKEEAKYTPETVTKIVKRERDKAYEKGKREAMMELQQQQQAAAPEQQNAANVAQTAMQQEATQTPSSIGGMTQMTPDQIKQMIMQVTPEAFAAHARQLEQKGLADSFISKMTAAEAKYPGLGQKLNDLDFSTLAPVIKHINHMENSADIMHELLENPMKMGNLISLVYAQPKQAEKAIQNLSASIKMNDDAKAAEKSSQEPFSQQKPSLNAGKDDGNMSVSDFQAMFRKKRR